MTDAEYIDAIAEIIGDSATNAEAVEAIGGVLQARDRGDVWVTTERAQREYEEMADVRRS